MEQVKSDIKLMAETIKHIAYNFMDDQTCEIVAYALSKADYRLASKIRRETINAFVERLLANEEIVWVKCKHCDSHEQIINTNTIRRLAKEFKGE